MSNVALLLLVLPNMWEVNCQLRRGITTRRVLVIRTKDLLIYHVIRRRNARRTSTVLCAITYRAMSVERGTVTRLSNLGRDVVDPITLLSRFVRFTCRQQETIIACR